MRVQKYRTPRKEIRELLAKTDFKCRTYKDIQNIVEATAIVKLRIKPVGRSFRVIPYSEILDVQRYINYTKQEKIALTEHEAYVEGLAMALNIIIHARQKIQLGNIDIPGSSN